MQTVIRKKSSASRYAIALLAALSTQQVHAAAIAWDNGNSNQLWSDSVNWNPDSAAAGNDITFNATGVAVSGSLTNIVDTSVSANTLTFTNTGGNASAHTTQINPSQTLTVSAAVASAFNVGQAAVASASTSVVFTGSGSLAITGGLATTTFTVGAGAMTTGGATQILDMSGLANFSATAATVSLGTGQRNAATVSLATTSSITATTMSLGGNTTTGGNLTTLNLGQTNTINANTINVGGGRSAATIKFLSTLTGPTVNIANAAGTGSAALNIGLGNTNATGIGAGIVDFGLGTVNGSFSTIAIGASANGGGAGNGSGTLTFGLGAITATTINAGVGTTGTNAATTGTGTVNMNASSGTLTATTVTLGNQTNAAGTVLNNATGIFNQSGGTAVISTLNIANRAATTAGANVSGTYNLAGGILKAQTIQAGANGTGTGTVTRAFNWTGGTIQNLNSSNNLTFGSGIAFTTTGSGGQTFSVDSGRSISVASGLVGTGGFIKTGLGNLFLSGTNIYSGGTVVNQGGVTFSSGFTMAGSNGFALSGAAAPVAGSDYGFISATAGTFSYGGDLAFTFSGTAVDNTSYNLFDIAGATLGGTSFSNVSIGGSYTASFTNSSGVWSATTGGFTFTFTESTGDLGIVTAVPEPSTFAALAGALGLGFAACRRRRSV